MSQSRRDDRRSSEARVVPAAGTSYREFNSRLRAWARGSIRRVLESSILGSLITLSRNPTGQSSVSPLREAVMWRIAFMSLAILGIALGACAREVQIAKPVTGDYEVVALMAD